MDQFSFPQEGKTSDQLLRKYSNQGGAQAAKLILFDQFIQIDAQKLEDKTKMLAVNERIFQP